MNYKTIPEMFYDVMSSNEDNEMIFYKSLNDLSEKIFKFTKDEKSRKKIARNGKIKYLKYFNSTVVADYIIRKTLDINYNKNSFIWEK